jgi:alanine-glyoxylate transaminase/serine-glyoxylate transaminase/serine-pyruvate transaminase
VYRRYGERRTLTPGPTALPQRVKAALVRGTTNPDLDPRFFEEYRETVDMTRRLIGAEQGRVIYGPARRCCASRRLWLIP